MFDRLGAWIAKHWAATIVAWLVLATGLAAVAPAWDDVTHDGDLAYLPQNMTSVRAERLLNQAFASDGSKSQMAIVVVRENGPLTEDDIEWLDEFAADLYELNSPDLPLVDVWTNASDEAHGRLASDDGRAAIVLAMLPTEFLAVKNIAALAKVRERIDAARAGEAFPPGLTLAVTGSAAVGGDMLTAASESIANTERTTIVLVLLILLLVYRAPMLAIVPLATIAASVVTSASLTALLAQLSGSAGWEWFDYKIFKTTRIFIVVILFGSGTDFCLFLISRYREELSRGLHRAAALQAALANVGGAVAGSALTTILGLGTMLFADFGKYRNSGPTIAMCLAVTLAACLTLAPALVRALGPIIFWPLGSGASLASQAARPSLGERAWEVIARRVIARPGTVLIVSVLALLPFAWEGLDTPITYDLLSELPEDRPSRVGTRLLNEHFSAGDAGPMTVLATVSGGNLLDAKGEPTQDAFSQIDELTRELYRVDEAIVSVRSLSEPLGERPRRRGALSFDGFAARAAQVSSLACERYVAKNEGWAGAMARFEIVSRHNPFSPDAAALLDRLHQRLTAIADDPNSAWHGAAFDFAGTTAGVRDLKAVTESDQTRIRRLVVLAVLAVLIVLLKRPGLCLFLMASVLFSYFAAIGATEMLFRSLFDSFDGLDWKAPLFLFVILVAVGIDYNIYLATRIIEEQRRHDRLEGLRVAVVRTGGIVTSCGVIMAGTFVSMMSGTLRGMLELGFALSFGVMLDTFIVRPVLAPAGLAWWYRRQRAKRAEPVPPGPPAPWRETFAISSAAVESDAERPALDAVARGSNAGQPPVDPTRKAPGR